MLLKIVIAVIVILIGTVVFIIVGDIRRRKKAEEERKAKEAARKRKPQPKVRTRKRPSVQKQPAETPEKTQTPPKAHKQAAEPSDTTQKKHEKTQTSKADTDATRHAVQPETKLHPDVAPASSDVSEAKQTPQTSEAPSERKPKHVSETTQEPPKKADTPKTQDVELPEGNYPPFNHQRLLDMGLSDEDAKEFVSELVPQIEEQIPLIQQALDEEDFHKMERLTHSIKGSSTNIGEGGVADVLVDYNTYLKTGDNKAIAARYLEILKTYLAKLKERYNL